MAKRKNNEAQIKEVWEQLIQAYGLGRNYQEYQIIQAYKKVMGAPINKYTSNLFFKEGRLHVKITNGVIRDELNMGKTSFLKIINEELGEQVVLDVVFA